MLIAFKCFEETIPGLGLVTLWLDLIARVSLSELSATPGEVNLEEVCESKRHAAKSRYARNERMEHHDANFAHMARNRQYG